MGFRSGGADNGGNGQAITWDVSYCADDRIVVATVQGDLTPEGVLGLILETNETARKHDTNRVLSDLRSARTTCSISDLYQLPSILEQAGVSRQQKRALLVAQDRELHAFAETISLNRGYQVRVFETREDAVSWLTKKPNGHSGSCSDKAA